MNKVNGLAVRQLTASSWDGRSGTVVLLPLGSLEQHGPHLPIATDTIIAESVSQLAAAQSSGRAVVAPSVPYGVSYHHRHLPGAAVSLPASMLAELLVEIIDGLMGPKRDRAVIIVNGHGGNKSAMGQAIDEVGRRWGEQAVIACSWWEILRNTDVTRPGHAGKLETAILAHLDSESVDWQALRDAHLVPTQDLAPPFSVSRWLDCTIHHPTGVTDVASEGAGELGERLLTVAAQGLVELIEWITQAYRFGGLA